MNIFELIFCDNQRQFHTYLLTKGAATDMRYFSRSNFFRILVQNKSFSLLGEVVFKLGH